ncbi:MAG: hypothetical protein ALECFALPRED_006662 [Alectoria fallacina]|uniref:DUF7730 domain-containing protein n=1 Tax=Alectoria fallacina TaxID=1903189 RepID=A0A8H3IZ86_9LECA|nr:MAG: hypothetical protein ALECFALPRED_006662 [Alectoria fallacina]
MSGTRAPGSESSSNHSLLEQNCAYMAWCALLCTFSGFLNRRKLTKAYEYKREKARVTDQQSSPLPSKRINLTRESLVDQAHHAQLSSSISTPQPCSLGRTCSSTPAPFSPLLRLPFELRTYIYELALGGNFLSIRPKYCKTAHMRLSMPYPFITPHHLLFDGLPEAQPNLYPNQFSTTGLPLLLTCRSIYREAIHLLYSSNTFFISDLSVLIRWADRPLLRLQRLAEIRHLSVRWVYYSDSEQSRGSTAAPYDWRTWCRFWEIVATHMPGLKKLELRIEYLGRKGEVGVGKEWVKAMMGVRRMKEVTVEIVFRTSPWAGDRCEEVEKLMKDAWLKE